MKIRNLKDFNLDDKLVLLRVDINSPVLNGKVMDNPRLDEAANTIKYLIQKKAKVVVLAHQGRKGSSDFIDLEQHALIISKKINKKVKFCDDLFDVKAFDVINSLDRGQAAIMQNTRFYEDETSIEKSRFYPFAEFFDLYVNDAFSVSHREQGSIVIPPKVIPSCIGINFDKELNALSRFELGKRALYILGGAKIEDYFPIFEVLKNKKSKIMAAGVLANLFYIAQGKNLGYENSWVIEKGYQDIIKKLKDIYNNHKSQIILPTDFAIGKISPEEGKRKEIKLEDFPTNDKIWDIGHDSINNFLKEIEQSEIVFMKGPIGFAEHEKYSSGTTIILEKISELSAKNKLFSLLGGGHLTTIMEKYKIKNNFSHISTSGGALIYFISNKTLPGLKCIESGKNKGDL